MRFQFIKTQQTAMPVVRLIATQPIVHSNIGATMRDLFTRGKTHLRLAVGGLVLSALSACGGGGSAQYNGTQSTTAKYIGQFIDSNVANVRYETSTRSGITDSDGNFGYDTPGELVSFNIGAQFLGSAQAQTQVHIFDLNTSRADMTGNTGARIAQLLQSLDADSNPENGISIPASAHDVFTSAGSINYHSPDWDAKIREVIVKTGGTYVATSQALTHANQNYDESSCNLGPTVYKVSGDASLNTANLNCGRRAQLAVYFDVVEPNLSSLANIYLTNEFLTNGVTIFDEQKKKVISEQRVKASIDLFTSTLNGTVEFLTTLPTNPATSAEANAMAAKLLKVSTDFSSKAIAMLCAGNSKCSKDQQNAAAFLQNTLEFAGNSVACRASPGSSCAEALKISLNFSNIFDLSTDPLAAKKKIDSYLDLIIALLKQIELTTDAVKALKSPDFSGAAMLAAAGFVKTGIAANAAFNPDSISSQRSGWENLASIAAEVAEVELNCSAVLVSKGFETRAKAVAACTEAGLNSIYSNLTSIGVILAYNIAAPNYIYTGKSYEVANVAIREILSFNTFSEASLNLAPTYINSDKLGQVILNPEASGAKAYFYELINNIVIRKFSEIAKVAVGYNVDYDLIQRQIASEMIYISTRAQYISNGTTGTCASQSQSDILLNGQVFNSVAEIDIGARIVVSTAFSGLTGVRQYLINWDDGAQEDFNNISAQHSYATSGLYKVRVRPSINSLTGPTFCGSKKYLHVQVGMRKIDNFSPSAAILNGTPTTFNITGTNLPPTAPLDITFNGCANIQFVSQSAAQHQFTCTPNVADTLTAVIRTLPGTTPLGSFTVAVLTAPLLCTLPQVESNGACVTPTNVSVDISATNFINGLNVALSANGYGADTLMNAPPYGTVANAAEWVIKAPPGRYELFATYASGLSRPVTISFDGTTMFTNALAAGTGGFFPANRQTLSQGIVQLPTGASIMRVTRGDVFPHIKGFTLVPVSGSPYLSVSGGCVKDIRTGLVWEVKTTDGGLRDWQKTYTNFDDTNKMQDDFRLPTVQMIAADTNSVGFTNAVNASNLCGFSDWRIPSITELQSLLSTNLSPPIDQTWFPNTRFEAFYFSSTECAYPGQVVEQRYIQSCQYAVAFGNGISVGAARFAPFFNAVRLVRTSP